MATVYDVGDAPYIVGTFTNSGGTLIDPSTVTLYLKQPSGSVGTYTYGAGGSVTRIGTGTYSYTGTATEAGYWNIRWVGAGTALAALQDRYFVRQVNT